MGQARRFLAFGLTFATVIMAASISAQAADSRDLLVQKLSQQFTPTKFTADRSDIVTAGAVVALQKDGLHMFTTSVRMAPINVYKNGKLSQGMGDRFKVCMVDAYGREGGCEAIPQKTLVTGEKMWISSIMVADDSIQLQLVTDPYGDNGRYFATLKLLIPKGTTPSAEDAAKMIGEVLAVQPDQPPTPAQSAVQPAQLPPASVSPSSYAPIAPPDGTPAIAPVQTATPVQTVSPGMTEDQVIQVMGQPARKIAAGQKEFFIYPDTKMKITFTDGRVSDVE